MALEFVLLFSLSVFIMIVLLVSFYELNKFKAEEKIDEKMQDFAYSVQSEIIIASEMNDGYVRRFFLPSKVENTDYNISVSGTNLILSYEGIDRYIKIPYTIGVLNKEQNVLYKMNETVYINP